MSNILLNAASASTVDKSTTDKFIDMLLMEYKHNIRNGLYGLTSKTMAYNSNRIEGSRLSEEQTHNLFETRSVYGNEEYRAHDIEEMEGHFAMFNYMLLTIHEQLSIEMIKTYHKNLKQCVFEDIANGYMIGDWKTRPNTIAGVRTAEPSKVDSLMSQLLDWYQSVEPNLINVLRFHVRYETIHPFQDGNGRTGRIVLFRESITHGIEPFIVRDENKREYLESLKEARDDDYSRFIKYVNLEQEWFKEQTNGMF